MNKDIPTRLKRLLQRFRKNWRYLTIALLFLPDYLFYPGLALTFIYLLGEVILRKVRFSGSDFWWMLSFALYTLLMGVINLNQLGMLASLFFLFVLIYHRWIASWMSPSRYMKLQFLIVGMSFISFLFVFVDYRIPGLSNNVQNLFVNYSGKTFETVMPTLQERVFSTFDNPNYYAYILLIVILVCVNQLEYQIVFRNRGLVIFYSLATGMNLYALTLTQTRSVWIALIIGVITLLVAHRRYGLILSVLATFVVLLGIILMNPELSPRFMESLSNLFIRLNIWDFAFALIRFSPWFGRGFYTYFYYYQLGYTTLEMHAHNIYIESVLSFGIVGSCLLLVAIISYLSHLLKKGSYLDYPIVLAMMTAMLAYGIFDIPELGLQTSLLTAALMAVPLRKEMPGELLA